MAVSQLSIFNEALVEAGEETVLDLTPNTAMLRAGLSRYESIVCKEIETGEWHFATKKDTPDLLLTDDTRVLPYKYAIAADSLGIVQVHYLDIPLEGEQFLLQNQYVWAAYAENITFNYKFRPDESEWPRRFSAIVVRELTAVFMRGTERHSEALGLRKEAQIERIVARHAESRQRHNRPMGEGSIIARMRGIGRGFGLGAGGSDGGGGGNVDQDLDVIFGPGTDTVFVAPGVGYVAVDCSMGNRTIVFTATDNSLHKEVTIRKSTEEFSLLVSDGTATVNPGGETSTQRVRYRRQFGTVAEVGRSL